MPEQFRNASSRSDDPPDLLVGRRLFQKLNGIDNAYGCDDNACGVENRRGQCIESDKRLIVTVRPRGPRFGFNEVCAFA